MMKRRILGPCVCLLLSTAASPWRPAPATTVTLTVPAAPIPVLAAGRIVVVYELHVSNRGAEPLRLERLVIRGDSGSAPLASYDRKEIEQNVKLLAPRGAPAPRTLSPGVRAIVYVWLSLDSAARVPHTLTHTVVFANHDTVNGGSIQVREPSDLVLSPPVGAGDWWIGLGPSNTSDHRRSPLRVGDDTVPHVAQRFAIDWVKMDADGQYARDRKGRRNTDWYSYGEPVLAVAAARVVATFDSVPDNTPGENSRAVAMVVRTVLGNYVLLELKGDGATHRYALYGHLQPGTIRVSVGESVSPGQVLALIGNSGNSDGPHLHFHITEAADPVTAPLRGEGIPFVIDTFEVVAHDPELVAQHAALTAMGAHRNALPVEGDVIRIRRK
jgi:murein DD-endopeptidase MepM/ murein hydrolase activator NlpD